MNIMDRDYVLGYGAPLVVALIGVSDTVAGMLARLTLGLMLHWLGLIDAGTGAAMAHWSLF
jgi:hypothetical protein